MDHNNYGTFTAPDILRFERILEAPVDESWTYLTDSDKRGEWLASGDMDLILGGRVILDFHHDSLTPHNDPIPEKYKQYQDGSTVYGTVTRLKPPTVLSFNWGEESGSDSEVVFELQPEDGATRLRLTHRRLGDDKDLLAGIAAGWHTHLDILVDKLAGREPKPFWEVHSALEEHYENQLGLQ